MERAADSLLSAKLQNPAGQHMWYCVSPGRSTHPSRGFCRYRFYHLESYINAVTVAASKAPFLYCPPPSALEQIGYFQDPRLL